MDCDCKRRWPLRDYGRDAAARVESARKIIFDKGMSVGGDLDILKRGSLVPTRVTYLFPPSSCISSYALFQNAYYTELGANPAELMPVDPLHDWDLGVGKSVPTHTLRLFYAIGGGAINLFDAR